MKSEWEIGYIESSNSAGPRQTLEMFDFRFIFLRRKRAFFMHVLKKIISANAVKKNLIRENAVKKKRYFCLSLNFLFSTVNN